MSSLRLKHRHRLRRKEVASLVSELQEILGCTTFKEDEALEIADAAQYRLLVSKGRPLGIYIGDEPLLTLSGMLAYAPTKRYVTVDMGAVKFLANGADVMAPGVIDADQSIKEGLGVWVRDEKNLRPLVVGIAMMDAETMIEASEGKAVKTIHYVGDKIWQLGE
jgi:PUA domain protein